MTPSNPSTPKTIARKMAVLGTMRPIRFGVPLFEGVDLHQLADASELALRLAGEEKGPSAPLIFVAAGRVPVTSAQAIRLVPDTTFEHCPQLDVLIVTGNALRIDADRLPDPDTVRFVRAQAPGVRTLAPVGTGARIIAAAGCAEVSNLIGMEAMTSGYHANEDEP